MTEHPKLACGAIANDIDFGIFVARLNLTVHFCYNTYLGAHLETPIDTLFLHEHFTYVILNSGLWYNRIANVTEEEERRVRAVQPHENQFREWAPLSHLAYERDLALLDRQVGSNGNQISSKTYTKSRII